MALQMVNLQLALATFATSTAFISDLDDVYAGIQAMEKSILDRFEIDSGYTVAKQGFEKHLSPSLKVTDLNIEALADEYKKKVDAIIDEHREQLQHLVEKVEDRAKSTTADFRPQFYQMEATDLGRINTTAEQKTGVHFPIEVIKNSSVVQRDVYLTGITSITSQMKRPGDSMFRQYISTETGITRIYPARPWLKSAERPWIVDLFDPRFRPWYVSAVSAPKDVMFLLDFSGSVTGQTMSLMKNTVLSVMALLTPNDYINAVWYNSRVGRVMDDCFDGFVPANTRNKIMLHRYLTEMEATDIAHVTTAMNYSLQEFEREPEALYPGLNHRSNGHQVMLMLTDWIEGWDVNVLNEHKPLNPDGTRNTSARPTYLRLKKVRIFGYNVGYGAEFIETLHWLSCANKGFYSMINSLSDVRHYSRIFVPVLSRPLALTLQNTEPRDRPVSYTGPYMDAQGAGSMLTLSMPVLNKMINGSRQTFLGVAAIDIKISTLVNMLSEDLFGLDAYVLALDNNGYLIYHPRQSLPEPDFQAIRRTACVDISEPMKALAGGAKIMYGPSTEKTTQQMSFIDTVFLLDFLELEPDNEVTRKFRNIMIDRKCGKQVLEDKENDNSYTCRSLSDTEFAFAIVAHGRRKKTTYEPKSDEPFDMPKLEDLNRSPVQILMPSKYFCKNSVDLSSVMSERRFLHILYARDDDNQIDRMCEKHGHADQTTQRVLAEYRALARWRMRWADETDSNFTCIDRQNLSPKLVMDQISHGKLVFIQTTSSVVHVFANCSKVSLPPSLKYGIHQSKYFKQMYADKSQSDDIRVYTEGNSVMVAKPVYHREVLTALVGVFHRTADFNLNDQQKFNSYCNQSYERVCYLMTRDLSVLSSSSQTGRGFPITHLANLDWQLFEQLNNTLKMTQYRDYQHECETTTTIYDNKRTASVSAAPGRPTLELMFRTLSGILTGTLHALWHHLLPSLSLLSTPVQPSHSHSSHPKMFVKPPRGRGPNGTCPYANSGTRNEESCIMEFDSYSYEGGSMNGEITDSPKCDTRTYSIVAFNYTNLLFVVADLPCDYRAQPKAFNLNRRIPECDAVKIRYRQRPGDTLYSVFHVDEDASQCGKAATLRVTVITVIGLLLIHWVRP